MALAAGQTQPPLRKDNTKPLLANGSVLNQKWRIEEHLAFGTFGEIYKVKNMEKLDDPAMAVKVESLEVRLQLYGMEVKVMKSLRKQREQKPCPNFLNLIDNGRDGNLKVSYIIMPLCGKTLSDLRKRCDGQRLSHGTTLRLGYQMVEAVEFLHRTGFLHRDIK